MFKNCANYCVIKAQREFVLIQDVGPWSEYLTVTNAAESVVQELWASKNLMGNPRLFYVDSEGQVEELKYIFDAWSSRFIRFQPIIDVDTIGQWAIQSYKEFKER